MSTSYTRTAKWLHWLMALMLIGMLCVGFYMTGMRFSPQKLQIYSYHKWGGVTLFALLLARLAWRGTHRPPALPAGMSRLMRFAAQGAHLALYLLMAAMPISGWLMSSAKGVQTVWFGVLPLPNLVGKDKALGDALAEVHETLAVLLIVVASVHVLAALKHHLIDRDDVLTRMLPRR